jgi:hypothetical protein
MVNPTPSASSLLITGSEPVEELRKLISKYSYRCPLGQTHQKCPFRMFGLLNANVRENLIKAMTRESCLHFFELERECRSEASCEQLKQSGP